MNTRRTIRQAIRAAKLSGIALALALGGCMTTPSSRDAIVKAPPRCSDQTVQIYFEQFSAEVTSEGRAVLHAAATQSKSCKVTSVDVLGLADSVGGTPDSNLDLSKRRAQAVTGALTAAGLPAGQFKVAAVGEAGAATADGRSRPLRRRVDIVLHLSPS